MSFILDALKKSETERQEQSAAEFAGVPRSTGNKSAPRWLWLVGLLLAINLAVLIGLLLRPDSTSSVSNRATDNASSSSMSAALPATTVDTGAENSSASFEERIANARRNVPPQQTDTGTNASDPTVANVAPAREQVEPDLISQDPGSIDSATLYPSIHEVRASGAIDLPDLHIDIHVYGANAEDRFVFINMSKLREGSQLAEGPIVDEITSDGVVLRYQGQQFLLPRD